MQIMLHKLIKFVHVNVREQLRCQVPQWQSFSLNRRGSRRCKTADNFLKQPHSAFILNALAQQFDQYRMVDRIEKLSNVAFQRITRHAIVLRYLARQFFEFCYSPVRSISYPARKRIAYKCFLEQRGKHCIHGMVYDTITYHRFVDVPHFRIRHIKPAIWAMAIFAALQFSLQCKDIPLKIPLERHNIRLIPFPLLERVPG